MTVAKPGIFPTFFMSGFECSTFVWKDKGRRDLGRRNAASGARRRGLRDAAAARHRRGA
jgi:hypothetical protein